jgi:hypothetical protein
LEGENAAGKTGSKNPILDIDCPNPPLLYRGDSLRRLKTRFVMSGFTGFNDGKIRNRSREFSIASSDETSRDAILSVSFQAKKSRPVSPKNRGRDFFLLASILLHRSSALMAAGFFI